MQQSKDIFSYNGVSNQWFQVKNYCSNETFLSCVNKSTSKVSVGGRGDVEKI